MNKLLMFLLRSNKTEAIRNKYRGAKFMKVADLPELKGEVGFIFTDFTIRISCCNLFLSRYCRDL